MAAIILTFLFLSACSIARADPLYSLCSTTNFTANSTYQANLNGLLSSLVSDTQKDSGFYNVSYGKNSDKVSAIGFCRGDISEDACRSCITNATAELKQQCPNQKAGITWHDECTLRYSNRSLFGTMDSSPAIRFINNDNATNMNQFSQVVTTLLDGLRTPAASGGSLKYATGSTKISDSETVYGLMQCSPDISETECSDCLSTATGLFQQCCAGKLGGRTLTPSCNFRYENYLFYNETQSPSLSPAYSPSLPPVYSPMLPPVSPPSVSFVPTLPGPISSPAPLSNTAIKNGKTEISIQILVLLAASLVCL